MGISGKTWNLSDFFDYEDDGFDLNLEEDNNVSRQIWFKYTTIVMYTTLSLLSFIGNCIFCMVIARQRMLHSVTNLIMANLGLANIAFTLLNSPVFINRYILQTEWNLGVALCKLSSSGVHLTATCSFYLIALVAVDRWLSVFTRKHKLTIKKAVVLIGLIWIVGLLLTTPYIWLYSVQSLYGDQALDDPLFIFESHKRICNIFPDTCDRSCAQMLELGTIVVQYVLPLCVIVPCYSHLAIFMWRRPVVGVQSRERLLREFQRKRRVLSMLLSIVVVFVMCWLPLYTLSIIATFTKAMTHIDSMAFFVAAHILALFSVFVTPFLYLMNDVFRTELVTLLKCKGPSNLVNQANQYMDATSKMIRRNTRAGSQIAESTNIVVNSAGGKRDKRRNTESFV